MASRLFLARQSLQTRAAALRRMHPFWCAASHSWPRSDRRYSTGWRHREDVLAPRRVRRPGCRWSTLMTLEVWDATRDVKNLFITPEIRSRIMRFEPHQLSSGHTHDLGHEMFLVLEGQAEFTIDGSTAVLGAGQACVARAGQWHEVRAFGDGPMTLYLSVTPHVEPTHTQWDREGGNQLPYRYGGATRAERETEASQPVGTLLEQHLSACS